MRKKVELPLPGHLKELLFSGADLESGISAGENPVAMSIEKWKKMADCLSHLSFLPFPLHYLPSLCQYIGYETCGLCVASLAEYEARFGDIKTGSDKCKLCDFASVDQCTGSGSVFRRIEDLMTVDLQNYSPDQEERIMNDLKHLTDLMITNLQKLYR